MIAEMAGPGSHPLGFCLQTVFIPFQSEQTWMKMSVQRFVGRVRNGNAGPIHHNSLIPHANPIPQHRRAVFFDRCLELRSERGSLGEFVRRADHLPISADRFVDFDGDGHVLVIPQHDFVFELVQAVGEPLVIGLLAFGNDVKCVADVQADGFVLRGCGRCGPHRQTASRRVSRPDTRGSSRRAEASRVRICLHS